MGMDWVDVGFWWVGAIVCVNAGIGIRRIVEYRLEKTELEKMLHKAAQK